MRRQICRRHPLVMMPARPQIENGVAEDSKPARTCSGATLHTLRGRQRRVGLSDDPEERTAPTLTGGTPSAGVRRQIPKPSPVMFTGGDNKNGHP